MKRLIPLLTAASLMLTGCYATRIVTVAPDTRYQGGYSTTVTVPRTSTVTTTTRVTALSEDISLCLDLQAIGAAFAQSSTVQDFENLINNSSYMLSNLDLNQDGYVDYLRVIETVQGGAHVFVIQAVLAPDVYQDVATLVAEVSHVASSCYVPITLPGIHPGTGDIILPATDIPYTSTQATTTLTWTAICAIIATATNSDTLPAAIIPPMSRSAAPFSAMTTV